MQSEQVINYYNSEIKHGNLNALSELAAFYDEIGDRKNSANTYLRDKIHKSDIARNISPIVQSLVILENNPKEYDSEIENIFGLTREQNSQQYKEFLAMLCE